MHLSPLQIGAIVVGAVVVRLLWDRWRRRGKRTPLREPPFERLQAAPLVPLGEVTAGRDVRVQGRAAALPAQIDQPLERAPLSGQACLAWQLTVARSIGSPNDALGPTGEWEHLLSEAGGDAVELRDGAHAALVRLHDAHWPYPTLIEETRYESELTAPQRACLERHGLEWQGYWKPMLRFFEHVMLPGEPLQIFGVGRHEDAPEGPYRSAPARLVFAADAERPLVLLTGEAPSDGDDPDDEDGGDDDAA